MPNLPSTHYACRCGATVPLGQPCPYCRRPAPLPDEAPLEIADEPGYACTLCGERPSRPGDVICEECNARVLAEERAEAGDGPAPPVVLCSLCNEQPAGNDGSGLCPACAAQLAAEYLPGEAIGRALRESQQYLIDRVAERLLPVLVAHQLAVLRPPKDALRWALELAREYAAERARLLQEGPLTC